MIRLSASSIKNYIKCSKMFYYYKTFPEESVSTRDANIGTVIHRLLETNWQSQDYQDNLEILVRQYQIDKEGYDKIVRCLTNFYTDFPYYELLTENDLLEYSFVYELDKTVSISGKIDRIVADKDVLFDWKTGISKRDISNDVQFIIYYEAYKSLFSKIPKVYQVNLSNKEYHLYMPRQIYTDALYNSIIPKIVASIKKNEYYKEGYFNGGCYRCNFISACNKNL